MHEGDYVAVGRVGNDGSTKLVGRSLPLYRRMKSPVQSGALDKFSR
jgi:hypothetical protein